MARILSPRYPNLPLEVALKMAAKIHRQDMCHPVERAVAAKHMGFSGITGSSDRAIAALMHFGLLEKVGKGEVRVSQTAVDILHPEHADDRKRALRAAASSPDMFRMLRERYGDSIPSEESLKSYLTRQGFIPSAVPAAAKAYLESCHYLQQQNATESGSDDLGEPLESRHEAMPREADDMETGAFDAPRAGQTPPPAPIIDAALNDIRVEIAGGRVRVNALLDMAGLAKLKRKIEALEMLIGDDEEQQATGQPSPPSAP